MTIISSYSFHRWVQGNDRRRLKPLVLERYSFIKRTAFLHLLSLLRFIKSHTQSSELVLPCLRHLSGEWPPCFWWESKISAILHKKFLINKPEPAQSSTTLRIINRLWSGWCISKLYVWSKTFSSQTKAAAGFHNGMRKCLSPTPATKMRCMLESGPALEPPGGHAPSWSTALGSAVTIGHRWVCLALCGIC